MGREELDALRAEGWDDRAILDLNQVEAAIYALRHGLASER